MPCKSAAVVSSVLTGSGVGLIVGDSVGRRVEAVGCAVCLVGDVVLLTGVPVNCASVGGGVVLVG
jgi:hypothetical protein